ncbi:trans-resveratrol di-O-methyltransferase [Tanacetum coccineum]
MRAIGAAQTQSTHPCHIVMYGVELQRYAMSLLLFLTQWLKDKDDNQLIAQLVIRHESYTSFGDSMLIAFYLAVMIFRICCLAADSGRKVECEHESYTLSAVYDVRGVTSIGLHESYTSFGDSMLEICCLAADVEGRGRCVEILLASGKPMCKAFHHITLCTINFMALLDMIIGAVLDESVSLMKMRLTLRNIQEHFEDDQGARCGGKYRCEIHAFRSGGGFVLRSIEAIKMFCETMCNHVFWIFLATWRATNTMAAPKKPNTRTFYYTSIGNAFGSNQKESSSYEYQQSLMPKGITPVVYLGLFGGVNCLAADNMLEAKVQSQQQIPDIVNSHGAPMLLSELVEALSIDKERSHFVYGLMRILVHSGFFVKQTVSTVEGNGDEKGEGYMLAPASRFLLKEEPLSIRPFLLAMLDPVLMDPWQHMSKWFQNDGANSFHITHGRSLWEFAGQEPKLNHLFNEAMASDACLVSSVILVAVAKAIAKAFRMLIVDVGGGTGTVAKAIAKAFPDVSCTSFDLPHVVNGLVGTKNLSYVGGDMFEAIPKADAVLLKWILHDWNDEECIKILKRCKEAIPSKENGGKLIIIDMVVQNNDRDGKSLETKLFFDMLMMALLTGRERNEKDLAKLFLNAGFTEYKITPILGLRSLIEVYP